MSERERVRERVQVHSSGVSRTQQHFKKEVGINEIMSKYRKTGVIDMSLVKTQKPVYMDCSNAQDFRQVCEYIADVNNAFFALPADIRSKLGNDPANMLDVMQYDQEYAVELGLMSSQEINEKPGTDEKSGMDVKPGNVETDPEPLTED